ncbi:hypothetical protein [Motilimonas pumila]|uniref:Uncharacterized protein n=1 Tax=Motilimonas pumila TaxID=2303987 RepID=A0A418Y969_9GAMM|nr:hypothetical protein [Motilimonas pumila]RJG36472.1 hypothetical protein D1Z90_20385 [Motilimonas pumila]
MTYFYEPEDEDDFTQMLIEDEGISYIKHYRAKKSDDIVPLLSPIRYRSNDSFFVRSKGFDTREVSNLFWEYYKVYFPKTKEANAKIWISDELIWYEIKIEFGHDLLDSLNFYEDQYDIMSTLEEG